MPFKRKKIDNERKRNVIMIMADLFRDCDPSCDMRNLLSLKMLPKQIAFYMLLLWIYIYSWIVRF